MATLDADDLVAIAALMDARLSAADVAGLRYRLGLHGTRTEPASGTVALGPEVVVIPAADAPYLCSRASVKSALKIPSTDVSLDSLVDAAIVAASDWIERFCRQEFAETTYTLYFSPGIDKTTVLKGGTVLVFPFTLSSITTVHEDADRAFGASTLIPATDYYIKGNTLALYADGTTAAFQGGERTVKVVAVGGYATIPGLLQQAATMLATWVYTSGDRMRSNVQSESAGGHTVTYKDEDMPKPVRAMLVSGGFVRQSA